MNNWSLVSSFCSSVACCRSLGCVAASENAGFPVWKPPPEPKTEPFDVDGTLLKAFGLDEAALNAEVPKFDVDPLELNWLKPEMDPETGFCVCPNAGC